MTVEPMSLQRFRSLAAAYGSHVSRWPQGEREAALALLEVSEPARQWIAEESSLDALFAQSAAPELPSRLERRLNEIPLRAAAPRRVRWPFKNLWAPALGWAAAAVLGIALGSSVEDASDVGEVGEVGEVREVSEGSGVGSVPSASDVIGAETGNATADTTANGDSTTGGDDELVALALGSFDDLEGMP